MSFFTIIIPTYNSSKTISTAIASIVSQTFKDFEILIIDGFSTDNTIEIVNSYVESQKNIRLLSEKDDGIYDAMNKGISKAKGDWLYFLGSDDELFSNDVLKNLHQSIDKKTDKVVYGNIKIINDTGWGNDGEIYAGEFNIEKLFIKNIPHQAIFYHKDVFNYFGYYNIVYKTCADYDYNLKIASKLKLKYIDIIVANFIGGGASTNNRDYLFEEDYSKNIIEYYYDEIYHSKFQPFEKEILKQAKFRLNKLKLLQFFYLFFIGLYFKVKRLKKKAKHSIFIRLSRFKLFQKV